MYIVDPQPNSLIFVFSCI